MSTGCQTYVDIVQGEDPCGGERKSTGCIIDPNIYSELGLTANSTQLQFNQAVYLAFLAQKVLIDGLQDQINNL